MWKGVFVMALVRFKVGGKEYRESFGGVLYRFNRTSFTKVPVLFANKFVNNPSFEVKYDVGEVVPVIKEPEVVVVNEEKKEEVVVKEVVKEVKPRKTGLRSLFKGL